MYRVLLLTLTSCLLLVACMNYVEEELLGTWHCKEFDFTFKEDMTMSWRRGTVTQTGSYRPFGNSIELIGEDNKVLTRVTIKSLKDDSLIIDLPAISSRVFTLTRQ